MPFYGTLLTASDRQRLNTVMERTKHVATSDHDRWWTAEEICVYTGDKPESVRRMLRYLRSPEFGGHRVDVKKVSEGLFAYRVGEAGSRLIDES